MKYTLLIAILFFSCSRTTEKNVAKTYRVAPQLKIESDTIKIGDTLRFKGYLKFDPEIQNRSEIDSTIKWFELRFESQGEYEPFKNNHRNLHMTQLIGDTAYGEFVIAYSRLDTLPDKFEHVWNTSFLVNFKSDGKYSVDTTYIQNLKVIVIK